jgi:hypothetical protein
MTTSAITLGLGEEDAYFPADASFVASREEWFPATSTLRSICYVK